MNAARLIEEFWQLPSVEREGVLEFFKHTDPMMLSPEELGELARRIAEAPDEAEAERLKQEFKKGFYGSQPPDA
jgi:hypothetical protein